MRPLSALLVVPHEDLPGLVRRDAFSLYLVCNSGFQDPNDAHLEDVWYVLKEKIPEEPVVDHVVLLHVLEEGGADVGHVFLLLVDETLQNRGCVLDRPDQLDFRDIEFLRGFQDYLAGNALIAQPCSQFFCYFPAAAVRTSRNGDDRHLLSFPEFLMNASRSLMLASLHGHSINHAPRRSGALESCPILWAVDGHFNIHGLNAEILNYANKSNMPV